MSQDTSSLEILRGADPRVLDAAAQDTLDSRQDFAVELAGINTPMALRLLERAKSLLQRDIEPDQAFTDGFRMGMAIRDKLEPLDVADPTHAETIDSSVKQQRSKKRFTRWLGMKAAKFALATGVLANVTDRGDGV